MAEWIIEIKDGKFPIGKWTELVRCKDCKYLNKEEMRCFEVEGLGYRNVSDDDFCSRGECKNNGEENKG
jgi:hypothetical protein